MATGDSRGSRGGDAQLHAVRQPIWLVVGLGNPGAEYAQTRHNVGAEVVELLARRHGGRLRKGKEHALVARGAHRRARLALAVPLTYMNDSGRAVAPLARRFGVETATSS